MEVKVSYVSKLPLLGDSPKVTIYDEGNKEYIVQFIDSFGLIVNSGTYKPNDLMFGGRQWFNGWVIIVRDTEDNILFTTKFDAKGETVFIKLDAYALGDTIAWIPFVEEFRLKHECNVICSTFHNKILADAYPNILFAEPNTQIQNIYAQYYIGASSDGNIKYSPIITDENPLQKTASEILGMPYKEIRPDLTPVIKHEPKPSRDKKYVCISEYGSTDKKMWKEGLDGWQIIVDYLNDNGFDVLVISKEATELQNVVNVTGDISLIDRMVDLYHCEFFIGVSSGLAWLAWALGKHVVMISDVTPSDHEFYTDCTRINANFLKKVDYNEEFYSTIPEVIKDLKYLIHGR
jgi:autotransporter strand-loop-strand O-heptosyltransferase